jgi:hypothetical protein
MHLDFEVHSVFFYNYHDHLRPHSSRQFQIRLPLMLIHDNYVYEHHILILEY